MTGGRHFGGVEWKERGTVINYKKKMKMKKLKKKFNSELENWKIEKLEIFLKE